jgi:uncharacterized protein with PQ loop repeat
MSNYDYIAYFAGAFAFITSLPQLYQIINTKKVRDLNLYFFVIHSISDILYLTYGLLIKDYILSISMSLPAACNILIFILCLFYANNE